MKKVFIFGAGASLGSQGPNQVDVSKKSPLVNELFNVEYHGYSGPVGLDEGELTTFKTESEKSASLEHWLTAQWNAMGNIQNPSALNHRRKIFGQLTFYLFFLFKAVSQTYNQQNSYRLLLQKLLDRDESFGLINFNYDTLLDKAIVQLQGVTLLGIEDYDRANYVKPHGSINWLLGLRGKDPKLPSDGLADIHGRFATASSLLFNNEPFILENISVVSPDHPSLDIYADLIGHRFGAQYFYPLILMPLTSKLYKLVEGLSERLINQSQEMLQDVEEIFLVGYRAHDDIIRQMFSVVPDGARLHIIGNGSANQIGTEVTSWAPKLRLASVIDTGFNKFAADY